MTKPASHGGLHLGRFTSSAVIAIFIIACILVLPQKAGSHLGERAQVP